MTTLPSANPATGGTAAPARVAAGFALTSALVHLLLLDQSSLASLTVAAMAVACLPCAWLLWRRPTPAVWGMTGTVDGTMLLVHLQMLSDEHATDMTAMAHGGETGLLMWIGVALIGGQLALAGAVAALRR